MSNTNEPTQGGALPSVPLQPVVGPLGPKHTGMRVSASGLLGRVARGDKLDSGCRFMVAEMLKHLEQMASEYYAGKVTIVDEFLQLYALDDARPNPSHHDGAASAPSVDGVVQSPNKENENGR